MIATSLNTCVIFCNGGLHSEKDEIPVRLLAAAEVKIRE